MFDNKISMKESQIAGLKSEIQHDNDDREDNAIIQPKLKNVTTMYLWSLGITMGSFAFGYSLVVTTILASSIQHNLMSSNDAQKDNNSFYLSLCTTALPVGALIGSLLYVKILKVLKSENKTMILCDYCIIVLYLLQILSLNPIFMSILRFCLGLVIGVSCTIVPMYLKSIAPIKISGQVGSFNQILITVGIAFAYAMGFLIDDQDLANEWRWRVCVLVPCLACYLRILTCQKFSFDILERHIDSKNYDKLMEYVGIFYEKQTFSVQELIKSIKGTVEKEENSIKTSQKMNNRIILAFVLVVMNQFCGINAIIFYANQLFTNLSKGDSHYAVLMSFYMGIFQTFFTLISGFLVDKFGRRSLMILGQTIIILSLSAAYYILDYDAASGWDPKFASYAIFTHIAGFSLSLGPITFIYLSEILDDISQFMVILWVQTVLVSFFSNILIDSYGIGKVFIIFALISIICLVYVVPAMIETKGKNKKQIYAEFEGQKY